MTPHKNTHLSLIHILEHKMYKKPMRTDRYLHKLLNDHPRQKWAVLKMLVHRAKRICKPCFLDAELWHLEEALQSYGYSAAEVRRAAWPGRRELVGWMSQFSRSLSARLS